MFGDYWYRKQVSNPSLVANDDAKITITIAAFRKELEKAFLAGKLEGQHEQRPSSGIDDIFGGMFGKRS